MTFATHAAALLLLILAPAVQTRNSPWPPAVQRAVGEATKVCREAGGRPGQSPGLVKTADLNGDGVIDHVVDWSRYDCVNAASAMENGQDGATLTVLVGGPGGTAVIAYNGSVYGATIETVGGRARLWVDVAAMDCGQNARGVPFSNWQFCSRALVWHAATRRFVYAPMAQKRRIG